MSIPPFVVEGFVKVECNTTLCDFAIHRQADAAWASRALRQLERLHQRHGLRPLALHVAALALRAGCDLAVVESMLPDTIAADVRRPS